MRDYIPKKFSEEDEENLRKGEGLNTGKRSDEYPKLTELEVEFARRNGSRSGLSREKVEKQIKETNDALKKARLRTK